MVEDDAKRGPGGRHRAGQRILVAWLWVMLCIAVILTFSGQEFAANNTSHYLTPFLRWLYPEISLQQLRTAHFTVRRLAHVTEYALLAVLAFRALRLSLDVPLMRVGLLTLAVVLAVAGTDEARQAVLPTRTGSIADVLLDFAGGAVGVLLIVALHRWLGIGSPAPRPRTGA